MQKNTKKTEALIITALAAASIILALLISARLWFRLDLTAGKAYTISPVSRSLSKEITDEVRLTYFISEKLSNIHPVPGEIEDLLREYAAYSHGKIRFSMVDPSKTGMAETMARLGITGQQIQTVEKDQATVSIVYTGILLEYLDKTDVIPVVFSLDTLEYDLTTRIRSLIRGTEREVGVIVGDTTRTFEQNFTILNQIFANSGYKTRVIGTGEEVPLTLSCLFVLGGVEEFDDWALYRIDRYLQMGGKALFAAENFVVDMQYGINVRQAEDKGLLAMLASYGAEVRPALVLDESSLTTTVQSAGSGGFPMIRLIRYPFWVSVTEAGGNRAHPVSAGFAGVDMYWTSPLELKTVAGVEAAPLFSSTERAWLETHDFAINPDMEYQLVAERGATSGVKTLAGALSGKLPAYFAGKPKPEREGSGETLPDLPFESAASRIIVIGDLDFVTDNYNQRDQRNISFLLQAADWLGNDDDIIGIRNRAGINGRLDKIFDEADRARAAGLARFINMLLVPALVAAAGIMAAVSRRRKTIKTKQEATDVG
jgi:gliding-associated putative ABC transporter substrate-binding component GldG